MTEQLSELGALIQAAREEASLSARAVAEVAGISPVYLRAIERAENPKGGKPSRPSADALLGIARALPSLDVERMLKLAGYDSELAKSLAAAAPARGAVDDLLRQIQDASKSLNKRSPFMYARIRERLEAFAVEYKGMAVSGTLRCDSMEEQQRTQQAVAECKSHLWAISYQDEGWWTSKTGRDYMRLHEQLLAERPDVEMTRIFIVETASLPSLQPILEKHEELGINAFVLDPSQVSEYYWRDFVLYDDELLRTAVTYDTENDRKTAEFTDDTIRIAQARSDFLTLHRVARVGLNRASDVLARLESA